MYLHVSLYLYVLVCILYVSTNKILYLYVFAPRYCINQITDMYRYIQIHVISTNTYRYSQYRQYTYR